MCLCVLILACQCSTERRAPVNEIKALIAEAASAAEAKSIKRVSALLTDDFVGEGKIFGGSRGRLIQGLQMVFFRRSDLFVLPHLVYVDVAPDRSTATAKIWVVVTASKTSFEDLDVNMRGDVMEVSFSLEYKDKWRVSQAKWRRAMLARFLGEILSRDED